MIDIPTCKNRACRREIAKTHVFCPYCGRKQIKDADGTLDIPTPQQLPSGSYTAQIMYHGVRERVTRPTKRECEKAVRELKQSILDGTYISKADRKVLMKQSSRTLREAVGDYIETLTPVLSPSTIRGYNAIMRCELQSLMNCRLDDINDLVVQKAINEMLADHSTKTVKNAWFLCATVLNKETGKRFENVQLGQVVRNERRVLSPSQVKILLESVRDTRLEMMVLLGLHSLRMSEILAVSWADIDTETGIIHVSGAIVRDKENKMVEKKTNKNATSQRDIPIMIPRLKELTDTMRGAPDAKVCQLPICNFSTGLSRACKRAGLPPVTIHCLRHTFATLAFYLGMDEKLILKYGGWKNNNVMQSVYRHVYQEQEAESISKYTSFFSVG